MRKNHLIFFLTLRNFSLALLWGLSPCSFAQTIDEARNYGITWLILNQHPDGSWGAEERQKVISTSEALGALRKAGVTGLPYARGISWLSNARPLSTEAKAKRLLALAQAGQNAAVEQASLYNENRFYQQLTSAQKLGWGPYPGRPITFVDTASVMQVAAAFGRFEPGIDPFILAFMTWKHSASGWPEYPIYCANIPAQPCNDLPSRIFPTALSLLALADFDVQYGNHGNAITAGTNWLLTQQKGDGSFGDNPAGTVVETAVAYRAIERKFGLGHSAATAAQGWLMSQQLVLDPTAVEFGSWSNDPLLTATAMLTLPNYMMTDIDADGIPDEVEDLLPGMDKLVADSRIFSGTTSHAVLGETTPALWLTESMSRPFSQYLPDLGGNGPYAWSLITGRLPTGLSLNPGTGEISGETLEAGPFDFEYLVIDINTGEAQTVVARLEITPASSALRDGDLNLDGKVDTADVLIGIQAIAGTRALSPLQQLHGDVAPLSGGVPLPDGQFNTGDLLIIQRKVLGLVSF